MGNDNELRPYIRRLQKERIQHKRTIEELTDERDNQDIFTRKLQEECVHHKGTIANLTLSRDSVTVQLQNENKITLQKQAQSHTAAKNDQKRHYMKIIEKYKHRFGDIEKQPDPKTFRIRKPSNAAGTTVSGYYKF